MKAAEIAISTALKFLDQEDQIKEIHFVCFDEENYNLYLQMVDELTS